MRNSKNDLVLSVAFKSGTLELILIFPEWKLVHAERSLGGLEYRVDMRKQTKYSCY